MIGFNYRRIPALALARELISEGRLGAIRHVRAAYLQDWLVDPESPMTWRLNKETAGSGALGDIASHAIDQVAVPARRPGHRGLRPAAHLHLAPPRPDGPEEVTVDDAAWATLSLASGAVASWRCPGWPPARRTRSNGDLRRQGAILFDLENLNELGFLDATVPVREQGFRRILVNEPEHPYLAAWWPQGHVIGWEHTFTHEIRDFLVAIGTEAQPVAVVRGRPERPADPGRRRGKRRGQEPIIQLAEPSARHPDATTEGA